MQPSFAAQWPGFLTCLAPPSQLTTEEAQILTLVRPSTLGQASRIPNIRPTTVVTLLRVAKQYERQLQQQVDQMAEGALAHRSDHHK